MDVNFVGEEFVHDDFEAEIDVNQMDLENKEEESELCMGNDIGAIDSGMGVETQVKIIKYT